MLWYVKRIAPEVAAREAARSDLRDRRPAKLRFDSPAVFRFDLEGGLADVRLGPLPWLIGQRF